MNSSLQDALLLRRARLRVLPPYARVRARIRAPIWCSLIAAGFAGACDVRTTDRAPDDASPETEDVRLDDPATTDPVGCARVGFTSRLGSPCTSGEDCDRVSLCVDFGQGPSCEQLCSVGACDALCGAGSECVAVAGPDGESIEVDLDQDGQLEPLGVCSIPVAPRVSEPWGPCSFDTLCPADAVCVGGGGGRAGVCLPLCEAACPSYAGFVPECVSLGSVSACVIWCDPAESVLGCPEELQCSTLRDGGAFCAR